MRKHTPWPLTLVAVLACSSAVAQSTPPSGNTLLREADQTSVDPDVSPVRRIDRRQGGGEPELPPRDPVFRSQDGQGNNLANPLIGSAGISLRRIVPSAYSDGLSQLAGPDRPSARAISNALSAQNESVPNGANASDFLWQWGQFLDHDIDLTDGADPAEPANIAVPTGDPWFDPTGSGSVEIPMNRSLYDSASGIDRPRQQSNEVTAWIDASNVYGSDSERADALRTLDGSGRLQTSEGDLLPFNETGLPNAGGNSASLFLAGDVRANEQLGLTAMHTLFMREHNRLAGVIAERHPELDGDAIYQRARKLVGAEMQIITYNEYLPLLLGRDALRRYDGYRPEVDGSIANLFSTAAYRYGHSALSAQLMRLDANGAEIAAGHLALRDAFFAPHRLAAEGGIEPLLRGLASQPAQAIDLLVIDDVRNFLFGPPGAGGFDLAALNIQRGRDHGLPGYNAVRQALGLPPTAQFSDINPDPEIANRLASIYASPDEVDTWVGGLAEPNLPGAMVGRLIYTVVKGQFKALRDGDRFWYQRSLTPKEMEMVRGIRLADVIRRNTGIGDEIADDVFRVGGRSGEEDGPNRPRR